MSNRSSILNDIWNITIAYFGLAVSMLLLYLGIVEGVIAKNIAISSLFLLSGILLFLAFVILLFLPLIISGIASVFGQANLRVGSLGPFLLIIFAMVLIGGGGIILSKTIFQQAPEYQIGSAIIVGAGMLIVLLFVISTGFEFLNLSDKTQALGLPEGSIRSLIALLLILVFVMVGVFLYRQFSTPSSVRIQNLSEAQLSEIPPDKLINVTESSEKKPTYTIVYELEGNETIPSTIITLTKVTTDQITNLPNGATLLSQEPDGEAPVYTAYILIDPSTTAADVGKQLLTTIGTLVVAVAGFYFGTRAVTTARGEPAPPGPTISYIDPREGPPAGSTDTDILIKDLSGSGFDDNAKVCLRMTGRSDVTATDVEVISKSKITCKFELKSAQSDIKEKWDVLVINPDGSEGLLPRGFDVLPQGTKADKPATP